MPETPRAIAPLIVTEKDIPWDKKTCAVCKRRLGSEHLDDCWLGQLHNGVISAVPAGVFA